MLQYLEGQHRLTRNEHRVVFACPVVDLLNFYDFFIVSYVLASRNHDLRW